MCVYLPGYASLWMGWTLTDHFNHVSFFFIEALFCGIWYTSFKMASSAWPAISDDDVAQERRDFCDYENYALPGVVLSSFNEMRQTEDLIDVVLVTEDKQISCHRYILFVFSLKGNVYLWFF